MKKGTIHSIEEGGTKARVVPSDNSEIVTLPLVIPFYWRETMGNLQVNDEVFYDEDESLGGMIHGRTNGDWDNILRGTLEVTEEIKTPLATATDVQSTTVSASSEVTVNGKSFSGHTHRDSQGGTTSSPL